MKRIIFTLVTLGFYGFFAFLGALYAYGANNYKKDREQPIAFSHLIHAGKQKMECTFCHETAGTSKHASIPSVQKCMGCHENILPDSPEIQKIHRAWKGELVEVASKDVAEFDAGKVPQDLKTLPGNALVKETVDNRQWLIVDRNRKTREQTYKDNWHENKKFLVTKDQELEGKTQLQLRDEHGIAWKRIHWLPDHVYFSHKRHIKAGLQCTECHIRAEWMSDMRKVPSMKMGWCLECHNSRHTQYVKAADDTVVKQRDLVKSMQQQRSRSIELAARLSARLASAKEDERKKIEEDQAQATQIAASLEKRIPEEEEKIKLLEQKRQEIDQTWKARRDCTTCHK